MWDSTWEHDGKRRPAAWLCLQLEKMFPVISVKTSIPCPKQPEHIFTKNTHVAYSDRYEKHCKGNFINSGTWFVKVVHKNNPFKGFASAFIVNALHNLQLLWWISIVPTHICKSELENSKKASLYLPGRLVSIYLRGADMNTPNIQYTPEVIVTKISKSTNKLQFTYVLVKKRPH